MAKLRDVGAIELQNGQLSFTREFRFYVMKQLSGEKIPAKPVPFVQRLLGGYEPSLASLSIQEMSDVMTLLLFNFQSDANRILVELRSHKPIDKSL